MAEGNIRVTPEQLRDVATQIGAIRLDLDDRFTAIYNQMMALEDDGWCTESGTELRTRFANLRQCYFETYPPAMESYMQFLRDTADRYDNEEAARMSAVQEMATSTQ